mgnify:CR=1 FL=1
MRSVLAALDQNVEKWALLGFYVILVVTMAVEVIRREVFSYSSVWGEEIVRYSFIYLAWIAAAAAVKERGHIRIDVLFHYVPTRVKALLYIFGDLAMLFVAVLAFYWSWETVQVSLKFGSVSDGLRLPKSLFLMAVPIGFALMLLRLTQSIIRDVRDLIDGRPPFEGNKLFD